MSQETNESGQSPNIYSTVKINHTRLLEIADYDLVSGLFIRKIATNRSRIGDILGSEQDNGYIRITIGGIPYGAHTLAWFYVHKEWAMVDHKDRIRSHNWIDNLRKSTYQGNAANRAMIGNNTGIKGVYLRNGRYEAGIKVNNIRIHLGSFTTAEEAGNAYLEAARKYFGEFANG